MKRRKVTIRTGIVFLVTKNSEENIPFSGNQSQNFPPPALTISSEYYTQASTSRSQSSKLLKTYVATEVHSKLSYTEPSTETDNSKYSSYLINKNRTFIRS